MNQEEQRESAIECGAVINEAEESRTDDSCDHIIFYPDELSTYTAAVEAPLQARIAQLEEFARYCVDARGITINGSAMAYDAQKVLSKFPDTWLSEHDKEVEARERERCAVACEYINDAQADLHDFADLIRSLK